MSLNFYRTRSFWRVVTVAGHWFLSWVRWIQFTSSHTIFICLLFSHIRLREVLKWSFLSGFTKEIQYELVNRETVVRFLPRFKDFVFIKASMSALAPTQTQATTASVKLATWPPSGDKIPPLHNIAFMVYRKTSLYCIVLYCNKMCCIVLYRTVL